MKKLSALIVLISAVHWLYAQEKSLDYFLDRAIQSSPLLKDYQNQITSNRIDSMLLRANHGTKVDAFSAGTYAPVVNGWGYDQAITNVADVSAGLTASKEITWKPYLDNQYLTLNYQRQYIDLNRKISKKDLQKSITSQYISAYGNFKLYQSNKEILAVLKQQDIIAKKLTEQGVIRQTEYLSLLVNLQKQEMQVAQQLTQYKNDLATLNLLCGISDTSSFGLVDPLLFPDSLFLPENTVFYQQFVLDSMQLAANDARIDFDYKPKASLFVDGGYHSSFAFEPGKNVGVSAGISISVPIYDGHQRKMQHDKISIQEKTRAYYREFFLNQNQQHINMLWQQLGAINGLAAKAARQADLAKALVDADNKLMNSGDISVTEYILAVNNYLDARNMLIRQTISKYQVINEINYWSSAK